MIIKKTKKYEEAINLVVTLEVNANRINIHHYDFIEKNIKKNLYLDLSEEHLFYLHNEFIDNDLPKQLNKFKVYPMRKKKQK